MIKEITIQNYRSILDASISLSPFTLLIGANGTGKSNFLRLFRDASSFFTTRKRELQKHFNRPKSDQKIKFKSDNGKILSFPTYSARISIPGKMREISIPELKKNTVFSLDPENAGKSESLVGHPVIHENGSGVVQVLDSLKTGDREDLFDITFSLSSSGS